MSQYFSRPINFILSSLSEQEYQKLSPYLYSVSVSLGTTLYDVGEKIETIYFPESAIVSVIAVLEDGSSAETNLVGKTGIIGLPAILGTGCTSERIIVQATGRLLKISATIIKNQFDRSKELQKYLLAYTEYRIIETNRQTICNTYHTIEQRLARWLLRVQDLVESDRLFMTQELIAKMLGVQRSIVTIIAGIFQQAGLISYSRGQVIILDRAGLKNVACPCYSFLDREFHRIVKSQF